MKRYVLYMLRALRVLRGVLPPYDQGDAREKLAIGEALMQTLTLRTPVIVLLTIITHGSCAQGQSIASTPLRSGNTGIASRYPGDVGIVNDPDVVFVENFNNDLDAIMERWEAVKAREILSLSDDCPANGDGGQSLLITHVGGQGDGAHLYRRLKPGFEKLHYRFYVKFDEACAPIHHFFHVGGYHPATPWPQGGAGSRPRGDERFTTGVEPFGEDWRWDYYSYWMEMRGSPPRGQCWGNSFIRDPSMKVERGQWQCLELMMQTNDVGQSNGEMALWLDGKLISHLGPGFPKGKWVFDKFYPDQGGEGLRWNDDKSGPEPLRFPPGGEPLSGFRWRSSTELKLNFLWLLCYITKAPRDHQSRIWFDDIIVARDYIGPLTAKK